MVRGRNIVLKPGEKFTFAASSNLYHSSPSSTVMLECSLIKANVLGGQERPLLECIPLDRNSDKLMYQPSTLAFHSTVEHPVNTIDFAMYNVDGSPKNFFSDSNNMMITLLARKKKV